MHLILRPLSDPLAQNLLLRARQRLVRFGRRHLLVLVIGEDSRDQIALLGVSRHDRQLAQLRLLDRFLAKIKPEPGFPGLFIRAMTMKARLRENRANIPIEIQLGRWGGLRRLSLLNHPSPQTNQKNPRQ